MNLCTNLQQVSNFDFVLYSSQWLKPQREAVPLFNVNEYPRRSDASSSVSLFHVLTPSCSHLRIQHDTSLSNTVRSSSGRTHSIAEKP